MAGALGARLRPLTGRRAIPPAPAGANHHQDKPSDPIPGWRKEAA
jgi:hypothetical protein